MAEQNTYSFRIPPNRITLDKLDVLLNNYQSIFDINVLTRALDKAIFHYQVAHETNLNISDTTLGKVSFRKRSFSISQLDEKDVQGLIFLNNDLKHLNQLSQKKLNTAQKMILYLAKIKRRNTQQEVLFKKAVRQQTKALEIRESNLPRLLWRAIKMYEGLLRKDMTSTCHRTKHNLFEVIFANNEMKATIFDKKSFEKYALDYDPKEAPDMTLNGSITVTPYHANLICQKMGLEIEGLNKLNIPLKEIEQPYIEEPQAPAVARQELINIISSIQRHA